MSIPKANVRPVDQARALRAILAFRNSDEMGVEFVAREAAGDSDPESVAHLVMALTEAAARFIDPTPDADEQIRRQLLIFAQLEAEQQDSDGDDPDRPRVETDR
ncbi:hypothetical protein [Pseudarthrobacter oxydans]|uniref:hypothetical protein n=1 Tax=Pseudarthrobacter oxydans TaxID=1671 RepID=UPI002AA7EABC|nr:hypothetical protein [Pseudarthrobacter oxydans]WPU08078.1 hypothetical protein SMD14_12970 [Pseudarthrobacter oxydans]